MTEAKFFLPQSRLNKGQRKYCHCIMKSRVTAKKSMYPICYRNARRVPPGENPAQYRINPFKTNCVMNYQYSDYSLAEVQAYCKEKKIPTTYKDKQTGETKYYKKDKLVEWLIKNYMQKHQTKKAKQPNQPVKQARKT